MLGGIIRLPCEEYIFEQALSLTGDDPAYQSRSSVITALLLGFVNVHKCKDVLACAYAMKEARNKFKGVFNVS